MFLHKAIKPAGLFVNHIQALLQEMCEATAIAIGEFSQQDSGLSLAPVRLRVLFLSISVSSHAYIFTGMPHFMV
jgi:hypothetical protein